MENRALGALNAIAFVVASATLASLGLAADSKAVRDPAVAESSQNESAAISELKSQLAQQQKQIEQLQQALEEQKKLIEASLKPAVANTDQTDRSKPYDVGQVASATPMIPLGPPLKPAVLPPAAPAPAMPAQAAKPAAENASPLQFHIGSASITPVGFMDFTPVWRSTNPGSGIGTNFGSVPYNSGPTGRLSEFRLSAQNSRFGIRVDANVKGTNVLGYMEADYLGPAASNIAVTNNADPVRLRLYWVDARKGKWEILGGQSWSMLTPNRKGLSALPADLFYSQDIDVNYQAGLVWSRNAQFRLIYHPSKEVTAGVSFENPDQYIGGSGGGGVVTLPSAFAANNYSGELNNGTTTLAVPDLMPDIVAKIAFDPKLPNGHGLHFEVAGVVRAFKLFNPNDKLYYTTTGGGGSVNLNYELVKNLRVLTNNYWSDGGGRWIFGLAPDLIVRADGSPSLVHSGSTVSGLEWAMNNTALYSYYGGVYIGRNVAQDLVSGKATPVGYGFSGSPNSQNRSIQELTFGLTQTFWKDPKFGALQLMGQYSYVFRNPWYVAPNSPKNAFTNMVFLNLRYTLPGTAPTIEY
jgi:hypothetical protein